ncbi:uncharacterized protein LOC6585154 isoform X1 [Drosophila mojavensis]|uniref:Uncharacterized protein, isoform A n=1 Tax=Drosophila mojavensis TaxID=7230 RepID=B4L5I9_DROMO|nr:uncharacterized protein LOC6585154 isoform X1 [Drosophila mojavensis]EDW06448.1 uncharacterized protein Dmoj_GI21509, isoform A [Drosophila mojavensis]
MPLKAVCIELRPNLSSGHVFLQFDQEIRGRKKTRLIIKEHDVHIVENGQNSGGSQLVLRHDTFGMDIQRISVFIANGCHISFRFNYTTLDVEALENSIAVPMKAQPLVLGFEEHSEQLVALHCNNCRSELVPGCSYNRLRECPSGLIDPSEFFCHNHGPADKPAATLVPGPKDLYYGLNYIVLNMSVLQDRIMNRADHLYCKRCMWMLGLSTQAGAAAKLWADALRWLPQPTDATAPKLQPRQLFKHSTVTQLMLRLLSTLWPTLLPPLFSPANSRAVLVASMPDRQQHHMLIQVLEPQLTVLRRTVSETEQLQHYRACKLYFRVFGSCPPDAPVLTQWQQQIEVPKMHISPHMFLELQARFDYNSALIPHAWRYNSEEEKLLLSYFFYETEAQERLNQQRPKEQPQRAKPNPPPQNTELDDYETDAGLDASVYETDDESDDERSDSDSELTSPLLSKSTPIMVYEQNLAKRWLKQQQRQPSPPPTPPDPSE